MLEGLQAVEKSVTAYRLIGAVIAQAWREAYAGKNVEYLHNVHMMLKEWVEAHITEGGLDIEYPKNPDNKMLIEWHRKISRRFAQWGSIANDELRFSIRQLHDDALYEQFIVGYKDSKDFVESSKFNTLDITKWRNELMIWSRQGGFSLVYKILTYEDYRTLQGLYSDCIHSTRKALKSLYDSDDFKLYARLAHASYEDFITHLHQCVKISPLVTKFEAIAISELKTKIPSLKDVKRKLQKLRPNQTELKQILQNHIEVRQLKPLYLRNVNPVRHVKPEPITQTIAPIRERMVKPPAQKLVSSFDKKPNDTWCSSDTLVVTRLTPEELEKL